MKAAQAMQQGGGWPLNVFCTPDLKPFFAGYSSYPYSSIIDRSIYLSVCLFHSLMKFLPSLSSLSRTYFPKPQFMNVLRQLAAKWESSRDDIQRVANEVQRALEGFNTMYSSESALVSDDESQTEELAGPVGKKGVELMGKLMKHAVNKFDKQYGGFGKAPKFPPCGGMDNRSLLRL